MDSIDKILNEVVKQITPTKEERKEAESVIRKILRVTDQITKKKFEKTIAGSFIRDTWLRDKKEFDLFILFPTKYKKEQLEKIGLKLGKKIIEAMKGKYEIAYAEHPYVRGEVGGYKIDIVPCYKVKSASEIKSSVDRTPFHNKYIIKNLKKKMSNDVRLLKQFMKSIGVYGSDMKTLGFSGYLCELLIIKYGSFKNLVKKASEWKPGVFIDLENHSTIKNIAEYFRNQPLIVIDPTDPKRNVAAAVSPENFIIFVNACKRFLENPNKDMFFGEKKAMAKVEIEEIIKKRGVNFIVISFLRPKVVDDILWPQLRRTAKRVADFLEENEFKVLNHAVFSNHRSYMIFEMEVWELPNVKKVLGPPIFSEKHSNQFLSKYKNNRILIEDVRWAAEIERVYKNAEKILYDFLSSPQEKLKESGIGSYIAESLSKGFEILDNREMMHLIEFDQEFRTFISQYLSKNLGQ